MKPSSGRRCAPQTGEDLMDLRKLIVGLLAAGTLTLGVTGIGVAGAEEAPNPDRREKLPRFS